MKNLREIFYYLKWIPLLFAGWLAGSMLDLTLYLPGRRLAFILLGLLCIALVVAWLRWIQTQQPQPQIGWGWFAALESIVFILYLIVFPRARARPDANDSYSALLTGCTQITHLHFPYYAHSSLGNPISPMPGALLLALPFQVAGRVSLQNIFWVAIFMWFATRFFRLRSTALAFLLIILANAHTLVNILAGADYPINWIYVCVAAVLFVRATKQGGFWIFAACSVLLGLALSSRPTYLLVFPPLLLAHLWQRMGGIAAVLRLALPLSVTAAATLPFYLYDPAHFTPLHVTDRLAFLPPQQQHLAVPLLALLTFAVSCSGFLVRLTLPRLFLLAGIATAILLVTPAVVLAFRSHFSFSTWLLLGYSDAAECFLFIWAFCCMEDRALPANPEHSSPTPLREDLAEQS
jgi:hypothetical protein